MQELNGGLKKTMTPTELSRRHLISRYNVYYWMKQRNLGFKKGRFWYLTVDDQKEILRLARNRYSDRRVGKNPKAYTERQNATASEEKILADLKVDVFTSEKILFLLDYGKSQVYMRLMETISDYKHDYGDLLDHERMLLIFADLLGSTCVGKLGYGETFPRYKFVVLDDPEAFTIVYSISKEIFYIDVYAEIHRKHPDLKLRTEYLRLQKAS